MQPVRERIQGKVVMVTGAAGSIGRELCHQIGGVHPLVLVGFDKAETRLLQLEWELAGKFPGIAFQPVAGNITRSGDVEAAMEKYRPAIIYHAAAFKHVPLLESHLFAAVENNVFGTWRVAVAAARHGAECLVLISTDKAVNPASVMGATKRVAELLVRVLLQQLETKYVTVRFGNVLGSSGSVLPIFKAQIAAGGPLTVTDPKMERYFMTAYEAAQLVLQASAYGSGGETFVLDMGEPVKIVDLAKSLIRLSGLEQGREIEIEFTGVRRGEKLVEELVFQTEKLVPTACPELNRVVASDGVDGERMGALLGRLQSAVAAGDGMATIALLRELVPEYIPSSQVFQALSTGDTACSQEDITRVADRQIAEQAALAGEFEFDESQGCAANAEC